MLNKRPFFLDNMKDSLRLFGHCHKPHGIKGGLKLHLFNTEESILKKGMTLTLKPFSEESELPPEGKEFTLDKISFGNKIVAYFKNMSDRNEIEKILPFEIYVPRESFPELDEGEFYLQDLIGFSAVDLASKEKVGVVKRFYSNGIQDVFEIALDNGEQMDLPFVEDFFGEIDLEKNSVEIVIPELI